MSFAIDYVIQQRYRINGVLGRGGMGVVYEAYDLVLQRSVAIKVLPTQLTVDPEFVSRFQQEAITAANLRHPYIVTVHDVGQEDGEYFIIMEYVKGETLEQYLASHGPLSPIQVGKVIHEISSALDHAHGKDIVHRDIKPSNIMKDVNDHAVLMDFGLVRAGEGFGPTRNATIMGTPEYMAPEQILGQTIDRRTDIYALGVVAYEMLSGRTPFAQTTPLATAHAHAYDPPPALRSIANHISEQIEAVVMQALAKDPSQRYQTAGDFSDDLAQALQGSAFPSKLIKNSLSLSPSSGMISKQAAQSAVNAAEHGNGDKNNHSKPFVLWAVGIIVTVLLISFSLMRQFDFDLNKVNTATPLNAIVIDSSMTTPMVSPLVEDIQKASSTPTLTERSIVKKTVFSILPPSPPLSYTTAIFQWQPVAALDEDFSDPSSEWSDFSDATSRWEVKDGSYLLTITQANTMIWLQRGFETGDFYLSVDLRAAPDTVNEANSIHQGVLIRYLGPDKFYRLDYQPGKGLEFSKRIGGDDVVLMSRVAITDDAGSLRLGVKAEKNQIQIFANEQLIGEINDSALTRGDLALYGISGQRLPTRLIFDEFHFTPAATEAISLSLRPYQMRDGLWSIYIPETWVSGEDPLGTTFESPDRLARIVVFPVQDTQMEDKPIDVVRKALAQAQTLYPDFRVVSGKASQLAGFPAFDQNLSGEVLGIPVTARLTGVNVGGRGYALVMVAP
ncbi:MAG: serine/threonine-protein kinase, partial [Nitrosomonas ureae]